MTEEGHKDNAHLGLHQQYNLLAEYLPDIFMKSKEFVFFCNYMYRDVEERMDKLEAEIHRLAEMNKQLDASNKQLSKQNKWLFQQPTTPNRRNSFPLDQGF